MDVQVNHAAPALTRASAPHLPSKAPRHRAPTPPSLAADSAAEVDAAQVRSDVDLVEVDCMHECSFSITARQIVSERW